MRAWASSTRFHDRVVDALYKRLRVTERADDKTVKAVAADDREFVLGVRWHAEWLADPDDQDATFPRRRIAMPLRTLDRDCRRVERRATYDTVTMRASNRPSS